MILIMKEDRQKAAEADEAAKRDRIDCAEPVAGALLHQVIQPAPPRSDPGMGRAVMRSLNHSNEYDHGNENRQRHHPEHEMPAEHLADARCKKGG